MKRISLLLLFPLLLSGCSKIEEEKKWSLPLEEVEIAYPDIPESEVEKIEEVHDLQSFSEFMDYVCYASTDESYRYADVTEKYLSVLKTDFDFQYRNAGQQGILSHNFVTGYDLSFLEEGKIGIQGYIDTYGTKSYALKKNNRPVLKVEYFLNVLSSTNESLYEGFEDLPLYQENRGFVKAENSEELFYLLSHDYFPIVEENSALEELFEKMVAISFALMKEGMDEEEKYSALYDYIVDENTYDYDSFHYKDSTHLDYACYFLEGAILQQNAVCDGMVKALVSLCRLNGIEAYHVGASNGTNGHAYLYVRLGETYSLSSPTDGKKAYNRNGEKIHSHTNAFYLTDYDTSDPTWSFFSLAHPEILEKLKTVEPYDYYRNKSILLNGKEEDFVVDSLKEGEEILKGVQDLSETYEVDLEIELALSHEDYLSLVKDLDKNIDVVDNGYFQGRLLKSFVFLHA